VQRTKGNQRSISTTPLEEYSFLWEVLQGRGNERGTNWGTTRMMVKVRIFFQKTRVHISDFYTLVPLRRSTISRH